MMYEIARRAIGIKHVLMIILLTGCGGGSLEDESQPTTNKPDAATASSPNKAFQISSISEAVKSASSSSAPQSSSRNSSSTSSPPNVIDLTPPSVATLYIQKITAQSLTLVWSHSSDEAGVKEYQLERDGKLIATVEFPTAVYEDKELTPYTNYTYSIRAIDTSNNISEKSTPLSIRTIALNGATALSSSSKKSFPTSISSASQASSKSQQSINSSSYGSSTPTSSAMSSALPGSTHLRWSHPTVRANGEYLDLHEIAGYELRKKNKITSRTIYVVIEGNTQTEYTITDLTQDDIVDIAVYDTEGRYSDFIPIFPK